MLTEEQLEAVRAYVTACEDPNSGLSAPYGRLRRAIGGWSEVARLLLAQHDEVARLRAEVDRHESAKAEPDYRAMWRELQAKVATLEKQASQRPRLGPEQGAALDAETDAFEHVRDIMEDLAVFYRGDAEHVAWAMKPDPTHTPAVRRVVAWKLEDGALEHDPVTAYRRAARERMESSPLFHRRQCAIPNGPERRQRWRRVNARLAAYLQHRDERAGYR